MAGPGGEVRVLGAEDELRLLCLHQARHGMARPLWLCDVGACLEGLPEGFDWEDCLRGGAGLSGWTACVVGLARRLLGAVVVGDYSDRGGAPAWVERAVLRCWGGAQPFWHHGHGSAPIKDAFRLGLSPSSSALMAPSVLIQLAAFVRRKGPYLWRLLRPRKRPVGRIGPRLSIHRH
jgi:hypothetical protein